MSAIDSEGRTIWITDAHRDDGKRFIVRADEKLTAFLEFESAIRVSGAACLDGLPWFPLKRFPLQKNTNENVPRGSCNGGGRFEC